MTKEQTQEEKESGRKKVVKATLENKLFQEVMGSNLVKSKPFDYGKLDQQSADQTYQDVIFNEEFTKKKRERYQEKKSTMQQLNAYGEPSVSDSEVSMLIIQQLKENIARATIGELEKYSKSAGANLDFKVPNELKELSYEKVLEFAMKSGALSQSGELDESKLSDTQKDAMVMYQTFNTAYERACAVSASQQGYFSDINAQGSAIAEKYKSKEDSKSKK